MTKLKIAMVMDSWYPDINGVILVMENLMKNMLDYADITLIVPKMDKEEDKRKYPFKVVRVDSVPMFIGNYRFSLVDIEYFKLKKVFDKMDFDIVHIHSPFAMGRLGIRIAREKNIPVVATFHVRWEFEFEKYLKSKMLANLCIKRLIKAYKKCDSCISVNSAVVKVYEDYGYNGKVVVIPSGTDMKIVKNKRKSLDRINEMFKIDKDERVLLFVGRIICIKNIFLILDSLKELKSRRFKYKMIYVGDGPDYDALKKKINSYKLNNEIILTGRILDRELLKDIYYRADLFLFPSLFDTSSLVQKEAASQETPTLFIDGSVTSEGAINNVNAYTTIEDKIAFADRIEEIFKDKRLYNKVKVNARKQLARSWEDISKTTYNYYLDVISNYKKENKNER